jgi:hypothetical protein
MQEACCLHDKSRFLGSAAITAANLMAEICWIQCGIKIISECENLYIK